MTLILPPPCFLYYYCRLLHVCALCVWSSISSDQLIPIFWVHRLLPSKIDLYSTTTRSYKKEFKSYREGMIYNLSMMLYPIPSNTINYLHNDDTCSSISVLLHIDTCCTTIKSLPILTRPILNDIFSFI